MDIWSTLASPKFVDGRGVYLFVFLGGENRIVYVGITRNFENRWYEHRESMKRGNRTVWKISPEQDIYKLMSPRGRRDYLNTIEGWH